MRAQTFFHIWIGIFAILFLNFIQSGHADTNVSGTISVDTTWTKANSPYVVTSSVSVSSGTTLTIEPGVMIKFDSAAALWISGILIAKGNSSNKITFTKNSDSNWNCIYFGDSSTDASYDSEGNYTDGCVMEYCVVEHAAYAGTAGAIKMEDSYPFINYCTIKNNSSSGIHASTPNGSSGTLKIMYCTISNNERGIYCGGGGEITSVISNNTITNNTISSGYGDGGGIYCNEGTPTISNNTISSNTASSGSGGGIYCNGGAPAIINNKISNNLAAENGGGVCCTKSTSNISNNTINANTAGYGGGIALNEGTNTISKNVIRSNNTNSSYGGGIYCGGGGSFTISNNIINNNTVSSSFGSVGGGIYFSNGTCIISNNLISNNTVSTSSGSSYSAYGGGIYCSYNTSTDLLISNNCISGNSAKIAAGIYYDTDTNGSDFKYNTITSNKSTDSTSSTYTIYIKSLPLFNYNNIFNNTATYELLNDNAQGTGNLDAKNNWWGTTVDTDIQSKIYDWIDNTTKDYVDYSPFETAIRTDCPISPLTGLTAVASNGQIALSWSANSESDLAGYKVYWDTDSGHSYKNSVDIGNATKYTITGLTSGRYYVTVTAYDTDYNASSDSSDTVINENQTNGNESWYADESAVRLTTGETTPTPTASPTPQPLPSGFPTLPPFPTATPSQTPTPGGSGTVFGFVYNADEESLKNVTVNITGNNFSDSTATDEDGYYEFSGLKEGDYTLTYEKAGYQTYTEDISLGEGEEMDMGTIILETVENGMIYGYVVNIKGNPVEYVRLKLKGIKTKVTKQTSSDADGYFEFTDLEADTYIITAKKKGFKPVNQRIKLGEGEVTDIEIEMKKSSRRIAFVEH